MPYETTTDEPTQFQCRHIFTDGRRCASPTLRSPAGHEPFCYYHHTTRRPVPPQDRVPHSRGASSRVGGKQSTFTLPLPEDPSSIQHALGQVLQLIASNQLDSRRAGLLLYGLQIASLNLKRNRQDGTPHHRPAEDPETGIVTEITHDPTHGLLAPPAELHANQPLGSAQRLLEELGYDDEEIAILQPRVTPQSEPQQSDPPQSETLASAPAPFADLTLDLQACSDEDDQPWVSCPNIPGTEQKKKPTARVGFFVNNAGDHLISHTLTRAVPSAQRGLTSVFGMGTGGTLAVNSPANRGEAEVLRTKRPKDLLLAFESKNVRGAIVHN